MKGSEEKQLPEEILSMLESCTSDARQASSLVATIGLLSESGFTFEESDSAELQQ